MSNIPLIAIFQSVPSTTAVNRTMERLAIESIPEFLRPSGISKRWCGCIIIGNIRIKRCASNSLALPRKSGIFFCHHISVNICMLIFARVILLPKGQAQLGLSFRWWSSSCTKRRQLLWHWHIVIFPIGECGRKRDAQAWRYHNCQRQWQSDHLSTWRLGCDVQFYHFFFHSFCKFAVI